MSPAVIDEQQTLRTRAKVLLFGTVTDVVLAVVAFLWWDRMFPGERVPLLGWTAGLVLTALLLIGAAVHFMLYSRVRRRLERAPAHRDAQGAR